jgi:phenylacetate-CoA ligase
LQDEQLRRAVAHAAKHVLFYRRAWPEAGFDAERFGGLRDLQRIPIFPNDLVKDAIRNGELVPYHVNTENCTYIDSSGSSGQSIRTWKRPLEERIRRAIGLRTWFEHGFRWGDMTAQFQILPGPSHFLQRVGISRKVWISTANPLNDQLDQFLKSKADVIVGTPTALRRLCHAINECGEIPKKPKIIFCAGEIIDKETTDIFKQVLGIEASALFGQTETGILAWQCERRGAFHVNADLYILEILHEGGTAKAGEIGNLVVTDLRTRTMPLIRYNTTDLARVSDEPCPCGRGLPTIADFEGRASSSILLENSRFLTTREILNGLAGTLHIGQYRLYQESRSRLRLELLAADGQDVGPAATNHQKLIQRLQQLLGPVDVSIEMVGGWPPDGTGKTHTVFSEVSLPHLDCTTAGHRKNGHVD